jgi:hypothetical protein
MISSIAQMMPPARTPVIIALAVLAAMTHPSALQAKQVKHAPSFDRVPELIQNKAGLEQYRQAMSGTPRPDGLGTSLPPGFTAHAVARALAPGEKSSLATLVGVKLWPHRSNTYIALACFAGSQKEFDSDNRYVKGPSCRKYYDPSKDDEGMYVDKSVYLGVFEYQAGDQKPRLVANYGKRLDVKTSWKSSKLAGPQGKFGTPGSDESALMPEDYLKFDLAAYKITGSDTAIGLRVGWNDSYAGGTGFFEALHLFKIDGDKLINILSEPVYFYQDLAAAWKKDGTRNHQLHEGENLVAVLPGKTDDHFDIQLRTRNSKWKRVFKWDKTAIRYLAVPSGSD